MQRLRDHERCVKCGGVGVKLNLAEAGFYWVGTGPDGAIIESLEEHLIVECVRCGYEWRRLPLDAQPAERPAK